MIKVLMTTARMPINGISNVIMQYYRSINREMFQIDILTSTIDDVYKDEVLDTNGVLIQWKERDSNQIKYFLKLIRLLKNSDYDIIHVHGNSATLAIEMLAAQICKVPVRIAHSHNTTCEHKNFDRILRPLFYKSYTHAIACGIEAGQWLYGNREFKVVNNGIDLEKFTYSSEQRKVIRDKLKLEGKFIIGHVGRFTYQKNHEFLIHIFGQISRICEDAVLLLVGTGPLFDNVKTMASKIDQSKIIFYGLTQQPENLYSAFDVFALPSRFEGLPLVLVETQSSGLPAVVSDRVTREILCSEFTEHVPIDDEKKWIETICNIYKKYNNRDLQGDSARQNLYKAGYSSKSVLEKLEYFYIEALTNETKL